MRFSRGSVTLRHGGGVKRSPLKRYTRINPVRRKPRPGRLKGDDMTALRQESWAEHKGKCRFCGKPVAFNAGELAHVRNKRMHGDNLDNVGPAHKKCHRDSHNAGGKPCPKKVTADVN